MYKSDSCLHHIDTDIMQSAGKNGDLENKLGKPAVNRIFKDQTGQSYGDVLSLRRQASQDEQCGHTNDTVVPFTTNLKPKDAWVEPNMELEQLMPASADSICNEDVVISIVDKITKEGTIDISIVNSLVTHIGIPTKEPTSSPSPVDSREDYKPCAILVNGKWVNLNKRPCILVRIKDRMARVFRRLNHWYEEAMLDLVMLHAQRQANKRRDDALRKQNV